MSTVFIEFKGKRHDLEVDLSDTIEVLLFQIASVIPEFVPERHRFSLDGKALVVPNIETTSLESLGIKHGSVIVVSDIEPAPAPTQAAPQIQRPRTTPHVVDNPQKQMEMTIRIESSFMAVRKYEDPTLQQKARALVPLGELQKAAEADKDAPAGYDFRDKLLLQLLHWFKGSFFKWVNQPPCSGCGKQEGNMVGKGGAQPTPEERRWEAGVVEVYGCNLCGSTTRFPRYNHPAKLLETRCGRCGEWANCFTLICRSLGYDARHVVDWTDHVWTEVYSTSQRRWMHCDACEDKLDAPLMYESGWGKKLSYIIAFSAYEAVDVTRRYTRKFYDDVMQRRNLVSEVWLEKKLDLMNQMILGSLPPTLWDPILKKKQEEQLELEATTTTTDPAPESAAEQEGRISGSKEWKDARGESGKGVCTPKEKEKCAVPAAKMHIPPKQYQTVSSTNLDGILAKIKEFNASALVPEKAKISEANLALLNNNSKEIPEAQLTILEASICSWPFVTLFPLLDLARISVATESGAKFWAAKLPVLGLRLLIFCSPAAASTSAPEIASANAMMIMRFVLNALASEASRPAMGKFTEKFVDSAFSIMTRCSKNAKRAAGLCLVNLAKFLSDSAEASKDTSAPSTVASKILNHLQSISSTIDTEDTEVVYCLIIALGTSLMGAPADPKLVASLRKITEPKITQALDELLNV